MILYLIFLSLEQLENIKDKSSTFSVLKLDKSNSVNNVELNIYDISFTFYVLIFVKLELFIYDL